MSLIWETTVFYVKVDTYRSLIFFSFLLRYSLSYSWRTGIPNNPSTGTFWMWAIAHMSQHEWIRLLVLIFYANVLCTKNFMFLKSIFVHLLIILCICACWYLHEWKVREQLVFLFWVLGSEFSYLPAYQTRESLKSYIQGRNASYCDIHLIFKLHKTWFAQCISTRHKFQPSFPVLFMSIGIPFNENKTIIFWCLVTKSILIFFLKNKSIYY